LRTFFYKLDRRHKGGIVLDPMLRELAIRLTLLVFSKPTDNRTCRLLIGDGASGNEKGGYIIDPDLSVIDLRRSSLTRHRIKRQSVESRFLAGSFLARLGQIRRGACPVQAVCRVTDRLVLEFRGAIPWDTKSPQRKVGNLPARQTQPYPGWAFEQDTHFLRLWPDSPEGVLRLTAGMATGKTLCVPGPTGHRGGALLVQLRDFDGDEVALRAKVVRANAESWLTRIPAPPVLLTTEDRLAISRWAYPLPDWLTPELTENLL
jgi:hypothetical protein